MMSERQKDYIGHMVEAAQNALDFTEGLDIPDFLSDKKTQQAVVMSLMIVGEAATKLMNSDAELTDTYPEIPWRSMRGMRNRIAHGYFEIDLAVVWETVHTALPELLKQLKTLQDRWSETP